MENIFTPKNKSRDFKMIRVFFLFLLCTNVYGQIDTSKICITSKTYYEYTFSNQDEHDYDDYGYDDENEDEYEYGNDSDNELEQGQTYYDSVLIDEKEISYPIVKTPNENLNKFINNTIKDRIGINEFKGSSEKLTLNFVGEDRPSEFYMTYVLNFKNSRYLSFTFSTNWYAGGGGSGVTHDQVALTFDMANSKTLLLKDIIKDQYDTEVYNISISQLKKAVPTLFEEYGEIDNPQLFQFSSTLNFPVAIKKEGVVIYWNLSWGTRSAAEEVLIRFDEYSHIFNKNFLKAVKRE